MKIYGSVTELIGRTPLLEVKNLERDMDLVLKIVVLGRAARNGANRKNRQPLAEMYVKAVSAEVVGPLQEKIYGVVKAEYPQAVVTFAPPETVFEKLFDTGEADVVAELYAGAACARGGGDACRGAGFRGATGDCCQAGAPVALRGEL